MAEGTHGVGPGDREGFTLIELLVALAVFSLAALALLNLSGENTRSAARVEARTLGAPSPREPPADRPRWPTVCGAGPRP